MPTYEYKCKNCGHELEEFQSMTAAPLTTCPSCKTENLVRVIGSGGGMIFKGSGFYQTDYKPKGEKKESKTKSPANAEKKSTPEKKADSQDKPATPAKPSGDEK